MTEGNNGKGIVTPLVLFFTVILLFVGSHSDTIVEGSTAWSILHKVPEGHVGVYWRGGALQKRITEPGFHSKLPIITTHETVQVTVQTDKVTNIPCGTNSGTLVHFDKVEVVNQLMVGAVYSMIKNYTVHYDKLWIYDKIHHEINQFCSQHTLQEVYIDKFDTLDETLKETLQHDIDEWAPGLSILSIRVTKPRVPEKIRKNYEEIESEITRLKVAEQTQRLVEKQAETDRKRAVIEAEKKNLVAAIELDRILAQKLNDQRIGVIEAEQKSLVAAIELNRTLAHKLNEQRVATIQNEMQLDKIKAEADAELYRANKEAEVNKLLLTPEFLALETARALSNNTKIYFGEKIPNIFLDNQLFMP